MEALSLTARLVDIEREYSRVLTVVKKRDRQRFVLRTRRRNRFNRLKNLITPPPAGCNCSRGLLKELYLAARQGHRGIRLGLRSYLRLHHWR